MNMENSRSPENEVNRVEISRADIERQWDDYTSQAGEIPRSLVIEVTNKCPNNCSHCYANLSIGKNTLEMSPRLFNDWLDVVGSGDEKPNEVWLVGGEPTLNRHLQQFTESVSAAGMDAMIVTTGESFADKRYCEEILSFVKEVDVTIRSNDKAIHNFLVRSPEFYVPQGISIDDQMQYVRDNYEISDRSVDSYELTMIGLSNIADTIKENNLDTIIGLNVDMQAGKDLYKIVSKLKSNGIEANNLILQVQTFTEQNEGLADRFPNNWRKPTTDIVKEYCRQCRQLKNDGLFNGMIAIIDPLPENILSDIRDNINSEDDREIVDIFNKIYDPYPTPAIDPLGNLRPDVIREAI